MDTKRYDTKILAWHKNEKNLSLTEQLQNTYTNYQEYDKHGIRIIDSTPNGITEAALEMEAKG